MVAFNVVRFKVKPCMENAFLDAHRSIDENWAGLRHANIIKTGEGRYCIIAEWESMEALAGSRSATPAPVSQPSSSCHKPVAETCFCARNDREPGYDHRPSRTA